MALVSANGFFVAAEFSIVTVRKTRIDQLIAEGHRRARAVRRAGTAQAMIKGLGMHGADRRAMVHSEEELKMLVTASQEAGVLEEHEEQMLHRVFGFADLSAGKVMVPRTELVAVAASAARDQLMAQIAAQPHTRL